ncbi:MAG TPA: alkaline phosphatase family protein [Gaiellales bacterium]|nr:alkaline phosphatase family protein [Gaiellales bacterium]
MRGTAALILYVLAAACAGCAGGGGGGSGASVGSAPPPYSSSAPPPSTPVTAPGGHRHAPIVVVFMENHGYADVVGNPCCPYETRLTHEGTLFTHFYGVAYPSKPNYLAFGGGGTFGQVGSDDPLPPVSGQSVFAQMSAHGVDWGAWAESYPGGPGHCSLVPTAPDYALRHVAPLLFADVAQTSLCNRVTAVEPRRLPAFLWVTPNMCNDDHDCPPPAGDRWLAAHVPAWLQQGAHVFITYDTGNPDTTNGGGHVYAVLVGHGVPRRADGRTLNAYSALAGVERAFQLPLLGAARSAAVVRM